MYIFPGVMLDFATGACIVSRIPERTIKTKDINMAESIRILSYNLRSGRTMAGELDLKHSAAVIKKLAPDVAGLQEVRIYKDLSPELGDMPTVLAEETAMRAYFGRTIDCAEFEYGIGVLSACPSELMEVMLLPQPPEMEQRAVVVVKVRHGNKNFYMINTHLVFEGHADPVRAEQLQAITDLIREKGYVPAVLTGDFNAVPDAPCMKSLLDEWGMTDLSEPTFPANTPRVRIDYIAWYPKDSFVLEDFEVVNEPAASDHRPILAVLSPIN